jgi:hypothetical protein
MITAPAAQRFNGFCSGKTVSTVNLDAIVDLSTHS